MNGADTISICEIFGPTVQGEGSLIGLPTVFVRTGGCDYRCLWCDTRYAVDHRYRNKWKEMTAAEVFTEVVQLAGGQPLLVSLSGGNPALQPLAELIRLGRASGYSFAMETQGSIAKPWFRDLAALTLSPKPPSSGMITDWRKLEECLDTAGEAEVTLKIVVGDEDDYRFARQLAERWPQLPVYLQPCNYLPPAGAGHEAAGVGVQLDRLHWLVAKVLGDRWYAVRVLPQLHVLLWGNERGR
jgi:7-carboxy-7-deazaguanine synthase